MTHRRYVSPLRYPGGKARMAPFLADTFDSQWSLLDVEVWIEPFAGGLGAGLTLLDRDQVGEVWFCEANPALAAMWRALITDPHEFAARVAATTPTQGTYEAAREVVAAVHAGQAIDDTVAGLAAFVINRCSRSGIVTPAAGPIGGKTQSGRWTIASRFDPDRLADRVRALAPLTHRLRYYGADGIRAVAALDGTAGIEDEVMLFVDPPYVREGNRLYANGMTTGDHQGLADALNRTPARWVLTYDDEPVVVDVLYPGRRVVEFDIAHTANTSRIDREYAVLSANLHLPVGDLRLLPTGGARWVRDTDAQWETAKALA